jgi:hypothetical protein
LLFNTLIEFLTSWAHCQVHMAKDKKRVPVNFTKRTSINCILYF